MLKKNVRIFLVVFITLKSTSLCCDLSITDLKSRNEEYDKRPKQTSNQKILNWLGEVDLAADKKDRLTSEKPQLKPQLPDRNLLIKFYTREFPPQKKLIKNANLARWRKLKSRFPNFMTDKTTEADLSAGIQLKLLENPANLPDYKCKPLEPTLSTVLKGLKKITANKKVILKKIQSQKSGATETLKKIAQAKVNIKHYEGIIALIENLQHTSQ